MFFLSDLVTVYCCLPSALFMLSTLPARLLVLTLSFDDSEMSQFSLSFLLFDGSGVAW